MNSRPHGADHDHAIDLDGALDFLNTVDLHDGQPVEHFVEPGDAAAWLRDHGLLHDAEAHSWARGDLDRTRAIRDALRDVVDSVVLERDPAPGSIRLVNEVLDLRPRQQLELDESGIRIGHRHVASPASEAVVPIAEAIVDELATGRADRFRICANDRCRWTFYDASPTGRRRWCDMATCGNRAKAARHRARVRAADVRPTTEAAPPA